MTKFSNMVRYEVQSEYVDDFFKVCSDLSPMGGYYEGLLSQYLIKTTVEWVYGNQKMRWLRQCQK